MRAILAVDPGGSKCEALLMGFDGSVLGWGRSQPAAANGDSHRLGYGRTTEAVRDAVTQALRNHMGMELHVGLIGTAALPPDMHSLARVLTTEGLNEHEPAFMLAGEPCGVVALAGTGAMAYARDRAGRTTRLDGLGPLLGDHGSGFNIGLKAIQAVAQSNWHPRRATTLTEAIFTISRDAHLFAGHAGLVTFMLEAHDRAQIAAFAAVVDQEARRNDAVAVAILVQAAHDIAETVRDAAARLNMQGESYPLIGVGSVMMRSDIYWRAFTDAVSRFAPRFVPARTRHAAVAGAALHVLAHIDGVDAAAARRQLITQLDPHNKEQSP
jgi:N-acetylglucosamine kinase-like BadF-type ATPase